MKMNPKDRFMLRVKVSPETGCWEWLGTGRELPGMEPDDGKKFPGPYVARFYTVELGILPAYLAAWILFRGPVQPFQKIKRDRIMCRNKFCVSPDHHWAGFTLDRPEGVRFKYPEPKRAPTFPNYVVRPYFGKPKPPAHADYRDTNGESRKVRLAKLAVKSAEVAAKRRGEAG